jgi:diaminopimelate decarboxylase
MIDNNFQIGQFTSQQLIEQFGSPLYVYDAEKIREQYNKLKSNITYPHTQFHYACKANTNIEILKLLREAGSYIETVSKGEVLAAFKAGFSSEQIIFTCSNINKEELKFLIDNKITVNLDSLGQIEKYGQLNPGGKISIRINQGIGAGHHSHVITGGPKSKFGIHYSQISEAKQLAQKYNLTIIGIHQHIGSNILDTEIFMQAFNALLESAKDFADLEFMDFGGGFGVPYQPGQQQLNISELGKQITETFSKFCEQYGKPLIMKFEAGRFLVAEAGTLLVTVTDVKQTPDRIFVGVDSGFNQLIRPAMYQSYHEIINTNDPTADKITATIAGNVCESGDVFAEDREISTPHEGDVLAILNAGAYGFAMASTYNSRPRPAEILVSGADAKIIRARQNPEDII